MPKDAGPERKHFGGDKGLITEVSGGKTRYFWRCNFCKHEIGDKSFPNAKARVHLSGDVTLKTGLISVLCPKAPSDVKEQFALLEKTRRLQWEAKTIAQTWTGIDAIKSRTSDDYAQTVQAAKIIISCDK